MKKVLITGKNSYIGRNFKAYIERNYPNEFQVDSISVRGEEWRRYDFSKYDVVLHVAALVHKNENKFSMAQYMKVNRDLTKEIAKRAKTFGVNQFIFLSTIAVYGVKSDRKIVQDSALNPITKYGKSKLAAENELKKMSDDKFKLTIVRPPMIYGPNCPGNYGRLRKMAKLWGIYPKFKNQRSMIFIDNLSSVLHQIIKKKWEGVFLPQNQRFVDTNDLIKLIRKNQGKKTIFVFEFKKIIEFLLKHNGYLNKIYGTLEIDPEIYPKEINYSSVSFEQSVKLSEYK